MKIIIALTSITLIFFLMLKYFNTLEHYMAENAIVCTTHEGVKYSHVINPQNGWMVYEDSGFINFKEKVIFDFKKECFLEYRLDKENMMVSTMDNIVLIGGLFLMVFIFGWILYDSFINYDRKEK